MANYRTTVTSPRPADEVFTYLARFSNAAVWDPGVTAAAELAPEGPMLGSRYRLEVKAFGRSVPLVYEIVEFDPPRRVALAAENAALRSFDVIEVSPAPDGGSVVAYDATLALKGIAAVLTPVLGAAFRRIGDRAAAGLSKALGA